MFYGLIVSMYFLDNKQHHVAHIHVRYQDDEVVVSIPDGTVLDGDFDAGETFTFSTGMHAAFRIRGLSLDVESPGFASALPLFLDFTPGATRMTWTAALATPPVPEEPMIS